MLILLFHHAVAQKAPCIYVILIKNTKKEVTKCHASEYNR